jgi:hypothetical protein
VSMRKSLTVVNKNQHSTQGCYITDLVVYLKLLGRGRGQIFAADIGEVAVSVIVAGHS